MLSATRCGLMLGGDPTRTPATGSNCEGNNWKRVKTWRRIRRRSSFDCINLVHQQNRDSFAWLALASCYDREAETVTVTDLWFGAGGDLQSKREGKPANTLKQQMDINNSDQQWEDRDPLPNVSCKSEDRSPVVTQRAAPSINHSEYTKLLCLDEGRATFSRVSAVITCDGWRYLFKIPLCRFNLPTVQHVKVHDTHQPFYFSHAEVTCVWGTTV